MSLFSSVLTSLNAQKIFFRSTFFCFVLIASNVTAQDDDDTGCFYPGDPTCILNSVASKSCTFCNSSSADSVIEIPSSANNNLCNIPEGARRFCYGNKDYNWFDLYGAESVDGQSTIEKTAIYIWAHGNGSAADGNTALKIWSHLSKIQYPDSVVIDSCESINFSQSNPKIKYLSWESVQNFQTTADATEAKEDFVKILEWVASPANQDAYGIDINKVFIGGRSRGVTASWEEVMKKNTIVPIAGCYWMQAFSRLGWGTFWPETFAHPAIPPMRFLYNTTVGGKDGHKPENGMLVAHYLAKYSSSSSRIGVIHSTSLYKDLRDFIKNPNNTNLIPANNFADFCASNPSRFCILAGDTQQCDTCDVDKPNPCNNNQLGWVNNPFRIVFPQSGLVQILRNPIFLTFRWRTMMPPSFGDSCTWTGPLNQDGSLKIDKVWIRYGNVRIDDPGQNSNRFFKFSGDFEEIEITNPQIVNTGNISSLQVNIASLPLDQISNCFQRIGFQLRFEYKATQTFDLRFPQNFNDGNCFLQVPEYTLRTPWTAFRDPPFNQAENLVDPTFQSRGPIMRRATIPNNTLFCNNDNLSPPISESNDSGNIRIFPNPATDAFSVYSDATITELRIYQMDSKLVKHESGLYSNQVTLDISTFSKGIYLVEVHTSEGRFTGKLVR